MKKALGDGFLRIYMEICLRKRYLEGARLADLLAMDKRSLGEIRQQWMSVFSRGLDSWQGIGGNQLGMFVQEVWRCVRGLVYFPRRMISSKDFRQPVTEPDSLRSQVSYMLSFRVGGGSQACLRSGMVVPAGDYSYSKGYRGSELFGKFV